MKKLMIAAAAAAMICGVNAVTLDPTNCDPVVMDDDCDILVFKLTASGKAVQDVNDGAYKAVKALKISKGALAFKFNEDCAAEGACCYETADLYAQIKLGSKKDYLWIEDLVVGKWSIFGKNFEAKVSDYLHDMKKGSSTTVESDLFLTAGGAPGDGSLTAIFAEEDELPIDLWASAFGSMTAKLSKGKSGSDAYCDPEDEPECVLDFTPKSYSGWFVGTYEQVSYGWCFNCECGEYDIFGGTWKATFQKKYTTLEGAQKLAFGKIVFGEEEDDED